MKPVTRTWTGIAVMTFALTIAEVVALHEAARGANRWWNGDQARALRTAGAVVGEAVSDRITGRSRAPIAMELASLGDALAPLAGDGCRRCEKVTVVVRDRKGEARRIVREIRHTELREALRQVERLTL